MFDRTSHDFGTVARGAKVEQSFTVENIYLEDARIVSVRASCGCAKPEVTKQYLKTWDKAQVVVKVDTRGYLGQRNVTITVVFDKPFPAEVQLHIHCYIRSDVVVQPGVVQFGSVVQGSGAQQRVGITYAGRSDWQIRRVDCGDSPFLSAQAIQTARGRGQVAYDLIVDLKPDAPPGYIREQVYLITDDTNPRAARVPVPVEGVVQSGVTVAPSPLFMGVVEQGAATTRQLVVRGNAPFRITRVQSSDPRFQCPVPESSGTLHRLPVLFKAGEALGKASSKVRIETDSGAGGAMEVDVTVQVEPRAAAEKPAAPREL
jgi:hypothetical protein